MNGRSVAIPASDVTKAVEEKYPQSHSHEGRFHSPVSATNFITTVLNVAYIFPTAQYSYTVVSVTPNQAVLGR